MEAKLIKIVQKNGLNTVSARELHEKLGIKTRYNDWVLFMTDYGFEENKDFIAVTEKKVTAQGNKTTYNNHYISIDMAKEICMLQRSEIGRKFRQYFIECEKKLKEVAPAVPTGKNLIALALIEANKIINFIKKVVDLLTYIIYITIYRRTLIKEVKTCHPEQEDRNPIILKVPSSE